MDWLTRFTEFMRANGQPNGAAHAQIQESLRNYVIHDEWENAQSILITMSDWKTVRLNSDQDTVLHLAVSLNRTSIFNQLMAIMNPEDLEVRNYKGNTAFFMCASLGNVPFAGAMLRKNPNLAMKMGIDLNDRYFFPIHMAAMHGHRQMLQLLLEKTVLGDLQFNLIVKLFFTTLDNSIFDVAHAVLQKYPRLAASRNHDDLTPLHVIARKPREQYEATGSDGKVGLLMSKLWTAATFMENPEMLEFITKPSNVLFDAAESGNIQILDLAFDSNPDLFVHREKNRNLLDIAVLSRQEIVITHLIEKRTFTDYLMPTVDAVDDNILHLAGKSPQRQGFGSSRPHIQMQRELLWFKQMENKVPTRLQTMRNKDGLTPKEVFDREHAELLIKAGVAAKDTANYGMLVATIIATIVFAASLTVPGHDVSPEADSSIFQKKGWYIAFILSNSIALFSSSSSIIFFLSVLTSSLSKDEFISSLHARLMFGVTELFVATIAMVVSFTSACFLIFDLLSTWVADLVASFGSITVVLFFFTLNTLFIVLVRSFFRPLEILNKLPNLCQCKS